MKNKKLIGLLIVLAFITVLVVLNSALFTLQSISVNWLTTKCELETLKDYTMVDSIEKGESIFLVKKDKIVENLEKKYSYLRVVSIETKFPNKIVIHSAERESMFAIKISDNDYAIVDELGKVLSRVGKDNENIKSSELEAKPIKIILNESISPENYEVGSIIKDESVVGIIGRVSKSLRESNYIPTTSKGVFVSLEVTKKGQNVEIFFKTRSGISLVIEDAFDNMTEMLLLGLERYNYFHQQGVTSGAVIVWQNNESKIFARFDENFIKEI